MSDPKLKDKVEEERDASDFKTTREYGAFKKRL
jgi:hypothetical protein